jgi:hypothetical protein
MQTAFGFAVAKLVYNPGTIHIKLSLSQQPNNLLKSSQQCFFAKILT